MSTNDAHSTGVIILCLLFAGSVPCVLKSYYHELRPASKFPLHILYIYGYFHVGTLSEMDSCYGMAVVKLFAGVVLLLVGGELLPDAVE